MANQEIKAACTHSIQIIMKYHRKELRPRFSQIMRFCLVLRMLLHKTLKARLPSNFKDQMKLADKAVLKNLLSQKEPNRNSNRKIWRAIILTKR